MDKRIEMIVGLFYAAGVIMAAAAFMTVGLLTGAWLAALFACAGAGIGFGLIMHGLLVFLDYRYDKKVSWRKDNNSHG
ncbi:putative phage tail protein [Caldalkalibacillus uzonensis]|uniref:Phage tail protein n=1 Tax=Caldalkalibacillus uzonensis TaxID=353224 RepID=A0ABU0CXQ2_9BACI|nr:hypothetical protein [Caldalkalibacillus uzonensis]MDQ0340682.1 putative phage tail protein [Caldalkalibacillus uzonensis]